MHIRCIDMKTLGYDGWTLKKVARSARNIALKGDLFKWFLNTVWLEAHHKFESLLGRRDRDKTLFFTEETLLPSDVGPRAFKAAAAT